MTRSYFNLVLAFAIVAVTGLGYLFFYHSLAARGRAEDALAAQLAAEDASASDAAISSTELATISDAESAIKAYFVNPANIVSFLEQLQTLGTAQGASVTVISVTANQTTGAHIDLSIKITGPFDAVMRTTGGIEYSPYDLSTESFTINQDGSDAKGSWTAALLIGVGTVATSTPETEKPPPP